MPIAVSSRVPIRGSRIPPVWLCDVLIAGRRYPVVGTVSMDNITVDLGADAGEELLGEEAILIGAQGSERITAEEVAKRLQTINYEVTCALTPRVPRQYHRDGDAV